MFRFGVSVYPDMSPKEKIIEYLELVARYGCTRMFSSMFSVEGTNEEVLAYFRDIIDVCHTLDIEVSLDVNPECFERFNATPADLSVFADLKVDILRMDLAYGLEDSLTLINNPYGILIEFNASMAPLDLIQGLIDNGVTPEKILVCHNFYPQRYTAMKWQKFKDINRALAPTGIRIGAFISSHAENTHGVWDATDGLPTVERHRDLPIDLQLREILATGDVTDIFIGNAYASETELQTIQEVMKEIEPDEEKYPVVKVMRKMGATDEQFSPQYKVRVIPDAAITALEAEILFDYFPHSDFGDGSEWIWRSRMSRFIYSKNGAPVREVTGEYFERGDVVMVNNNYQHYAGEVQVVRIPIKNDGTRNRVARLSDAELNLLESIPDGKVVVFIK